MCPRHLPLVALLVCGYAGAAAAAQMTPPDAPLQAGVAAGSPPFVIQPERGPLTGFTIELFRAIAGHLKREIRFTAAPPDELAHDLEGKKFDFLPGPIDATPEAAQHLLFTEGYTASEYEFGSRAGEPIRGFADLRGRRLAVAAGSPYAGWAERNAARYGFTVQEHATVADVLGALATGHGVPA